MKKAFKVAVAVVITLPCLAVDAITASALREDKNSLWIFQIWSWALRS